MNWLAIAVAVFLLVCAIVGYRKGLLKQGLILFGAVILLWLMSYLLPYTKQVLKNHTPIETYVYGKVDAAVQEQVKGLPELTKTQEAEVIERTMLPKFVKKIFLENNNSEIYNRLGVETFTEYMGAYATELIVNIIAYVTTSILAFVIYRCILAAAHVVDHLPLARSLNHGLGGVLGLAQGLVVLCVFFVILVLFCRTQAGKACYSCIDSSVFLTFLYEHNPLMAIVSAVAG